MGESHPAPRAKTHPSTLPDTLSLPPETDIIIALGVQNGREEGWVGERGASARQVTVQVTVLRPGD